MVLPWSPAPTRRAREIVVPPGKEGAKLRPMKGKDRTRILKAVATGRAWMDELVGGRITSPAAIASREILSERSVRMTLSRREIIAEPFLIVGIIASIKEIILLSVEAANVLEGKPTTDGAREPREFALLIALLALLVVVLAVSAVLLRLKERQPVEGRANEEHSERKEEEQSGRDEREHSGREEKEPARA